MQCKLKFMHGFSADTNFFYMAGRDQVIYDCPGYAWAIDKHK